MFFIPRKRFYDSLRSVIVFEVLSQKLFLETAIVINILSDFYFTFYREDSPRAFLNSEIISVAAYYEGKPVHSLDKEAFITFGNKVYIFSFLFSRGAGNKMHVVML